MPDGLARIYWDACVLLSYINGIPDRLPDLEWYLERSGKGFQLVTSTMTIVEVAFAVQERERMALDAATEAKISGLWAIDGPVKTVEFYTLIAEEARQLIRQAIPKGWSLKPNDAIHLATARRIGASEFHTYDQGLSKYEPQIGTKIRQPAATTPMLPFPPAVPGQGPSSPN
jgi:predicted nucleic acid-binding protein